MAAWYETAYSPSSRFPSPYIDFFYYLLFFDGEGKREALAWPHIMPYHAIPTTVPVSGYPVSPNKGQAALFQLQSRYGARDPGDRANATARVQNGGVGRQCFGCCSDSSACALQTDREQNPGAQPAATLAVRISLATSEPTPSARQSLALEHPPSRPGRRYYPAARQRRRTEMTTARTIARLI